MINKIACIYLVCLIKCKCRLVQFIILKFSPINKKEKVSTVRSGAEEEVAVTVRSGAEEEVAVGSRGSWQQLKLEKDSEVLWSDRSFFMY